MMDKQKILVISGRKQSGKNTLANFVRGTVLLQAGLIDEFKVNESTVGELFIKRGRSYINIKHVPELNMSNHLIANYEFADPLKVVMKEMFGLTSSQVDGSNGDKDVLTEYLWERMPGLAETEFRGRNGPMTARQLTQFVGGNLLRSIDPDIHIKRTYESIQKDGVNISTIVGARYPNEVLYKPNFECEIRSIRLARTMYPDDNHSSETSLDVEHFNWNNFDGIIWNQTLSIEETCAATLAFLQVWEWI